MNADAQKTMQWILKAFKSVQSRPCDLECTKQFLYNVCILGQSKLKTQVSGTVRVLVSKILDLDKEAYTQLNKVCPSDVVEIQNIVCKLLCNKNQRMQEFERSAC